MRIPGVRIWLCLAAAVPVGCNLAAYEEKMQSAQDRAARFDEESKYLDGPVGIPTRKDEMGQDIPLADLFFRPPKGINLTPIPEPKLTDPGTALYHYVATPGQPNNFVGVAVAFGSEDARTADNVLKYLKLPPKDAATRVVRPPGREFVLASREYDETVGSNAVAVHVWQSPENKRQIVFVYTFDRGKRVEASKALDFSIESITVGEEAAKAHAAYSRLSPPAADPSAPAAPK